MPKSVISKKKRILEYQQTTDDLRGTYVEWYVWVGQCALAYELDLF